MDTQIVVYHIQQPSNGTAWTAWLAGGAACAAVAIALLQWRTARLTQNVAASKQRRGFQTMLNNVREATMSCSPLEDHLNGLEDALDAARWLFPRSVFTQIQKLFGDLKALDVLQLERRAVQRQTREESQRHAGEEQVARMLDEEREQVQVVFDRVNRIELLMWPYLKLYGDWSDFVPGFVMRFFKRHV